MRQLLLSVRETASLPVVRPPEKATTSSPSSANKSQAMPKVIRPQFNVQLGYLDLFPDPMIPMFMLRLLR